MQRVAISCLVIAVSLLLVGVVSGTMLRHAVQIAPALVAAALAWRKPRWGAAAALPVFATWIVIPVLIWMFLLGIARFVTGTFTPVEIFLTLVMAAASLAGAIAAVRLLRGASLALSAALFVTFAGLQLEAMSISSRSSISRDR